MDLHARLTGGLVFERDTKGLPALNAGCLWLNLRGALPGGAVLEIVARIWRRVQTQRHKTRGKSSSEMDQDVFNDLLENAPASGRQRWRQKQHWWSVVPAEWAKAGKGGAQGSSSTRQASGEGRTGRGGSGRGDDGMFGGAVLGGRLHSQPIHTRRLLSAAGHTEIACAAPTWMFREHIYSAESMPLLLHLVAVEDKTTAARVAGLWHREADVVIGLLPPSGETRSGTARQRLGTRQATETGEAARLHTLRRPALGLGPGWDVHVHSIAEHAARMRFINLLAAAVDCVPVWPPLPTVGASSTFARDAVTCADGSPRRGLVLPEGRTVSIVSPCARSTHEVAEIVCTPGACDAGGAPPICYLNPLDRDKPDLHWSPNRCYAQGGALFDVDVERLAAAGVVTRRAVRVPLNLLDSAGMIDLPSFVTWLRGELPADPSLMVRLAVYLEPPEGLGTHPLNVLAALRLGSVVGSWSRRLRKLAALCGGDGRGGVLMYGHENVTGGLCV